MSYCRFSEASDVYLYGSVRGSWVCCSCRFKEYPHMQCFGDHALSTLGDVLKHLQEHRDAGSRVPERASTRVQAEIEEFGADYELPPLVIGKTK